MRSAALKTGAALLLLVAASAFGWPNFGHWRKNGVPPSTPGAPDLFTWLLADPAIGAQCGNVVVTSDQADAITCTRGSTAYCTKSDGTMVSHSNNRCRVESAGLLVEPASTNSLPRSEALDNAGVWTASATVTANTFAAPWGGTTMDTLTDGVIFQAATGVTGPFALSGYGRAVTGTHTAGLDIYCSGGGLTGCACYRQSGGACSVTASATDCIGDASFSTTVDRLIVVASCGSPTLAVVDSAAAGVATGAHVWGGIQFELFSYATSYIPTAGTAVTRAADVVTTTLAQSIDATGCLGATVTYGPVFPGDNDWFSGTSLELEAQDATTFLLADQIDSAAITVPSLAGATILGRGHWDGASMSVVSGALTDAAPFAGSMSTDSVLTIGSTGFFGHMMAIRAGTSSGGCR